MNLEELRKFKPQIQALAREYKIDPDSIRVFGSVARGDATGKSDVDFLVTMLPESDLFDLSGFNYELETMLQCEVDTVPEDCIYSKVNAAIQDDVTTL